MSFTNEGDFDVKETGSAVEPDLAVEEGTGGGDMTVWSLSREQRIRRLIYATYENESSYTLAPAFVNHSDFDNDFTEDELWTEETPTEAEDGSGGGDMLVWSLAREQKISRLIVGTFSNNSSYDLPKVIKDAHDFSTTYEDEEVWTEEVEDESVLAGEGGGTMTVWSLTRDQLLNRLVFATHSVEAESDLPKGIVDHSDFDTTATEQEVPGGLSVGADITGPDGGVVEGRAALYEEVQEDIVATSNVDSATFMVASPPDPSVILGEDREESPQYNLIFSPDEGVSIQKQDVTAGDTYSFVYGRVAGEVQDVNGNPVADDQVVAGEEVLSTDGHGRFSLVVPDGTAIQMSALGRTVATTVSPGGEGLLFQYGGIRIRVVDPNDNEPISDVPVVVGDELYETDNLGEVYLTEMPIREFPIEVMGYFDFLGGPNSQGHLYSKELGGDDDTEFDVVSVAFTVSDQETGRPIADTTAEILPHGIRSQSGKSGNVSVLHDESLDDEFVVMVADDDPRYSAEEYHVDLSEADTDAAIFESELEPLTPTVNM